MGSNPSGFKGQNSPVENISWDDAQEFVRRLNQREGHDRYRLPTEAEWEYAARAGLDGSAYSFGDNALELDEYAWHYPRSKETHPVGQKKPNSWGLYDMHGNVWEWTQDWYKTYYAASALIDPAGPPSGVDRVYRGGSWRVRFGYCRVAYRNHRPPDFRGNSLGFRLALSPE
jgi:formylglycine-generating enzyme required for sulfatase activity